MLIDSSEIPADSVRSADICVVGAGPAGITLALELAEAGVSVLLLESGGTSWERRPNRLDRGQSVGYPMGVAHTRARGVGGSSLVWLSSTGLRARPLDPIDLESRTELPHSGWPFDRTHLDPYYERAHQRSGLGPYRYETGYWFDGTSAQPLPLAGNEVGTTVFQFGPGERWHSYLEHLAASPLVRLITHATVVEIETVMSPREVSGLRVRGPGRTEFTARARRYVLALGALETPRLLLASNRVHARGIGNAHDLVGRFYMEHFGRDTGVVHPTDLGVMDRLAIYEQRHCSRCYPIQGMLTVSPEVIRSEGLRNATFWVYRSYDLRWKPSVTSARTLLHALRRRPRIPGIPRYLSNIAADPLPVARVLYAELRGCQPPPNVIRFRVLAEQAPNRDSRVSLGRGRDELDMPRLKVDWRVSEDDVRSIERHQDLLAEALSASGIGEMSHKMADERPAPTLIGNAHHMGTTRMHRDARQGVVDEHCRVHDMANLFVAGSSVFPTGGYANPTLTIVALAIRLADHLKKAGS